ncbi:MAG: hypothetical protein DRO05_06775 [Thermoproteota archaeon]|nr:MAG: hypothetical protein DRO05_06775 [Candidatus Korarchaeota archaeon]
MARKALIFILLALLSLNIIRVELTEEVISIRSDSYISEKNPEDNYGNEPLLIVSGPPNVRRTVIYFDLKSIPRGSKIVRAKLKLTRAEGGGVQVKVHALTKIFKESDVNWLYAVLREYGWWENPGGDFEELPLASKTVSSSDKVVEFDITNFVSDVVAGRRSNYGLILLTPGSGYVAFYSSEAPEDDLKPVVEVKYEAPELGNFTIKFPTNRVEVDQGGSFSLNVKVEPVGSFYLPVHLSVVGLPNGSEYTFSFNNRTPTFSSILRVELPLLVKPGEYEVFVVGTADDISVNASFILVVKPVGDFEVRVSPEEVFTTPGEVNLTIEVIGKEGFFQDVSLFLQVSPSISGLESSFSQRQGTPNFTSILIIRIPEGTYGNYTLRIIGRTETASKTALVELNIGKAEISLSITLETESLILKPGESRSVEVRVSGRGVGEEAQLSVEYPEGILATLGEEVIPMNSSTKLNVSALEAGNYSIKILASAGGLQKSATLEIIISPPPSETPSPSPSPTPTPSPESPFEGLIIPSTIAVLILAVIFILLVKKR